MSGVQGKLSSRVMNMKFMRFSKDEDSETGSRETTPSADQRSASVNSDNSKAASGFHDSSEWFAGSASSGASSTKRKVVVVRKKRAPVTIVSDNVSVTQLQQQTQVPSTGRRTFGADKGKKRSADEASADGSTTAEGQENEDEDGYELDTMFKESVKRRKTEDGAVPKNRKKTKGKGKR